MNVSVQIQCDCGMLLCFDIPEWIDWPKPLTFTCVSCKCTYGLVADPKETKTTDQQIGI